LDFTVLPGRDLKGKLEGHGDLSSDWCQRR